MIRAVLIAFGVLASVMLAQGRAQEGLPTIAELEAMAAERFDSELDQDAWRFRVCQRFAKSYVTPYIGKDRSPAEDALFARYNGCTDSLAKKYGGDILPGRDITFIAYGYRYNGDRVVDDYRPEWRAYRVNSSLLGVGYWDAERVWYFAKRFALYAAAFFVVVVLPVALSRRGKRRDRAKIEAEAAATLAQFPGETVEERRAAIIARFSEDAAPVRFAGDIRPRQRFVGNYKDGVTFWVRDFVIQRSIGMLGPGIRESLLASLLLYNEGIYTGEQFVSRALPLFWEDGRGGLHEHDTFGSLEKDDQNRRVPVRTVNDAFAQLMGRRFETTQQTIERIRSDLYALREADNPAVRYLLDEIGL